LFIVVSELPTEDIKEDKIYCIKDTSSTAQDNGYIEYSYINNKWEKVGEFQAEPDLSNYARLDKFNKFKGANFTGYVTFSDAWFPAGIVLPTKGKFFVGGGVEDSSKKAFVANGDVSDIGTPEDFTFTLEDGSTVTKSIRVISTTSQAGA
jgi:hypothetical protein